MAQGRREIEVDRDQEFVLRFYENGLQEIPDSASWAITDNGGIAVASGDCSILEGVGDVAFTFAEDDNDLIAKNYKLTISRSTAGEPRYYYELFDVVAVPLTNLCSDEVLFDKLGELRTLLNAQPYRTTSEGGENEIVCLNLEEDTRDYSGGYLEIFFAEDDVHRARIVDYDRSGGSAIFSPSAEATVTEGLSFRIRPSFQRHIDDAFERHVKRDIRNRYGLASRLIDSNLVTTLTAFKTLELFSLSQVESTDDKWDHRYKAFQQYYKDELAALQEAADLDDDGEISDTEDTNRPNSFSRELVR